METIVIDFNDSLAAFLGPALPGSIAMREELIESDDATYRLTVAHVDDAWRISLFDMDGVPCPGFEVRAYGTTLRPEPDGEAVVLNAQDATGWLDLASLHVLLDGKRICRLQIMPEVAPMSAEERDMAREMIDLWREVYLLRTCPPLGVLKSGSEEARHHLAGCASCRELVADRDSLAVWEKAAERLSEALPPAATPTPAPGQIWSLSQDLDGWDSEGLYLRMPLVLVLEADGEVRVAPCCPEEALAGPCDLPLGNDNGFAEAWNLLTLPKSALHECLADVGPGIASRALALHGQTHALPMADWRRAFEDIEGHIAMECDKRALALHLAVPGEAPAAPDWRGTWQRVVGYLRDRLQEIADSFEPTPAVEFYTASGQTIPLLLKRADGSIGQARAEISPLLHDNGALRIKGRLLPPKDMKPSRLVAWLEWTGGDRTDALEQRLMPGGWFILSFPWSEGTREEHLRLALIEY